MEELKKILTSLLISSPLQLTLSVLARDYEEQVGQRIPYQTLGFNSLEHCLRSMPDVLEVHGHGPYATIIVHVSQKSAHINDLVTKQKKNFKRQSRSFTTKGCRPLRSNNSYSYGAIRNPRAFFNLASSPRNHQIPEKETNTFLIKTNNIDVSKISTSTSGPSHSDISTTTKTTVSFSEKSCALTNTTPKLTTTSLIQTNSNTFWNGSSPGPSHSDTSTPKTTVSSTEKSCSLTGTTPKLTTSLPQTNRLTFWNDSSDESDTQDAVSFIAVKSDEQNINNIIPKNVQSNLRTLMCKYDSGIWCSSLPHLYKEMFSKDLDYVEYGYRALSSMCLDLPDIFICICPNKGDHKLFYKPKGLPENYNEDFNSPILNGWNDDVDDKPAAEIPDIVLEQLSRKRWVYPDDVMHMHEEIPRQFLPEGVGADDFVHVVVGEIYDPSKFWLLLLEPFELLNNLMDEMQRFYASLDSYIPQHMIVVGMYCVAIYNHEYHRAIIVNVMINIPNKVKVYYIDYGTVSAVESKHLKFLHKRFCELPQQAIRSRLCGIYPPMEKSQWPIETSNRFLELVQGKNLVAHIYHIDSERQILEVFLADTSGVVDVYLNDALVAEGHAIFTKQEQKKIRLEPRSTPWVKHIHLFPTFEEIEYSAVPSAGEMCRLLRTGMPLEVIYPRYFGKRSVSDVVQDDDLVDLRTFEVPDLIHFTDQEDEFSNVSTVMGDSLLPERKETSSECSDCTEALQPELSLEKKKIKKGTHCNDDIVCEPKVESHKSSDKLKSVNEKSIRAVCSDNNSVCTEKIQATPALRPPPGFENIVPTTTSYNAVTHVGLDTTKNPFTHSTDVGPPFSNVNLLNLALNQQLILPHTSNTLHQSSPHIQQTHSYAYPQPQIIHQSHTTSVFHPQSPYVPYQNYFPPQFAYAYRQHPNLQFYGNPTVPVHATQMTYLNGDRTKLLISIYEKLNGKRDVQLQFVKFLYSQYMPPTSQQKLLCDFITSNLLNNLPAMGTDDHNNVVCCLLNSLNDVDLCELYRVIDKVNCFNSTIEQVNLSSTNLENVTRNLSNLTVSQDNNHSSKKRHLVIKSDLAGFTFHVIWYRQKPQVWVFELLQFLKIYKPIEEIRKVIAVVDEDLSISTLVLHNNEDIYNCLLRYIKVEKNTVLHIIPTTLIPNMVAALVPNSTQIHFEEFLKNVDADSNLWFSM